MRPRFLLPAIALFALAAPAATPAQPAKAGAQKDWSHNVVATTEGGFRMGNPDAPVKLIEYGSLTCPHCAHFAKDGVPPLVANHVKSGKVSFEFRNLVLNGIDGIAALLSRCAGPTGYFRVTEGLYATQAEWVGKIGAISEAEKKRISALPQADQFLAVANASGILALAGRSGVTRQKARQCFADKDKQNRLSEMARAAGAMGITGTPAFLINGEKVVAHEWAELEPLIRQAGD
ncbi:thioredoxin domain-containing protein [Sphingosinicella rhizophila]|uniref:Thioredoxin domain-containing protein n=1 Tax=Sphingosinicella rhizophila TaxID=3050082 RepID=A0ABU3Q6Z2_9SPHN|nr:thioredoxin domain-containing protein [Sphingosinicella sp. GR2756]MDT9599166.1 thioredoxin domain-containing protein [Sphingosinicella sp. GR2756]